MTAPDPLEVAGPDEPSPIENAAGYHLHKILSIGQLAHEISVAAEIDPRSIVINMTGTPPDSTIWILPANIDPALLAQAVADHTPVANWGVPQVLTDFNGALLKLQSDPEVVLTHEELQALLRGMALQFATMVSAMGGAMGGGSSGGVGFGP